METGRASKRGTGRRAARPSFICHYSLPDIDSWPAATAEPRRLREDYPLTRSGEALEDWLPAGSGRGLSRESAQPSSRFRIMTKRGG